MTTINTPNKAKLAELKRDLHRLLNSNEKWTPELLATANGMLIAIAETDMKVRAEERAYIKAMQSMTVSEVVGSIRVVYDGVSHHAYLAKDNMHIDGMSHLLKQHAKDLEVARALAMTQWKMKYSSTNKQK